MISYIEVEEHDFNTNLNLLHLGNEIDGEEEPLEELHNILEHHVMIKPNVSEFEDANFEPIQNLEWLS